jgi:1,2-phenylacetyl-CoA epoxidase catalytic subunit
MNSMRQGRNQRIVAVNRELTFHEAMIFSTYMYDGMEEIPWRKLTMTSLSPEAALRA